MNAQPTTRTKAAAVLIGLCTAIALGVVATAEEPAARAENGWQSTPATAVLANGWQVAPLDKSENGWQ
ncbi:hypothetical protein ACIRBY_15545 [Streptomyces sp. NPDC096136]|uniref:hypothetical protein n=1 Tax=Streptomyces sp. NPDC096136 TaxID=3366076 RepID=UPI0038246CB8